MKLTKQILDQLVDKHIIRYTNYLARAHGGIPGYRIDELKEYLRIWKSIKAVGTINVSDYNSEQQQEILDAFLDEYDELPEQS